MPSEITRRRADPRDFAALEELGTEPRTRYLAKIENPSDARIGSGSKGS
jgi:hypothetical protein